MRWENLKYPLLTITTSLLTLICIFALIFADQSEKKLMTIESRYEEQAVNYCKEHLQKVSRELYLASMCYGDKNYGNQLDSLIILCENIKSICSLYEFEDLYSIESHTNEMLSRIRALPKQLSPTAREECENLRLLNDVFLSEL